MLKLVKALESIRQYTEKKNLKTLREAKFAVDLIDMIANETLIEHAEDRMTAAKNTEMQKLVTAVRLLKARPSTRDEWDPDRAPALKIIDCVLSLNRPYDTFVVPRVKDFAKAHPDVRSVSDLQTKIRSFPSVDEFVRKTLDYKHEQRAVTLSNVVDWLVTIAGTGDVQSQQVRLEAWAKDARYEVGNPGISGFAIAGFQYARMLFGGDTAKPDVWIIAWVAKQVGRKVSAIEALSMLESAARDAGVSVRDVDTTIWEASQCEQVNAMRATLTLVKSLERILEDIEKRELNTLEEAKAMIGRIGAICTKTLSDHAADFPNMKRSPYSPESLEKFDRRTDEVKAQANAIRAA